MPNSPRTTLYRIACLGDSHTKGECGYNWIELLREQWTGRPIDIANHGVNGELAYNARQRTGDVISYQPDLTLVLLGTNDVNARVNRPLTQRYITKGRLPQKPDRAFFLEHLHGIIDDLQTASQTRIALLTLPPLSEDLHGEANQMIDHYNHEIRNTTAQRNLPLIDLSQALKKELLERNQGRGRPLYQGRGLMAWAMIQRKFLFRSWNAISRTHGLHLLTDTIHLNETSGRILAGLVHDHLKK